jgi:para-nitrobenzyl esterase
LAALDLTPATALRLWDLDVEQILSGQLLTQMQSLTMHGLLPLCEFGSMFPFQPCVDGSVLAEPPLAGIRAGTAAGVASLIGTTRDEMRIMAMMGMPEIDDEGLMARAAEVVPQNAAERVVAAYRDAAGPERADARDIFFDIDTDRFMRIPAIRLAEAQARFQPAGTFVYVVTWESPVPGMRAAHGSDTPFFHACGHHGWDTFTGAGPSFDHLTDQVQGALAAFFRTGDPAHDGLPPWPAYDASRRATMLLGATCSTADGPLEAEREVWDGLL